MRGVAASTSCGMGEGAGAEVGGNGGGPGGGTSSASEGIRSGSSTVEGAIGARGSADAALTSRLDSKEGGAPISPSSRTSRSASFLRSASFSECNLRCRTAVMMGSRKQTKKTPRPSRTAKPSISGCRFRVTRSRQKLAILPKGRQRLWHSSSKADIPPKGVALLQVLEFPCMLDGHLGRQRQHQCPRLVGWDS